MRKIFQKAKNIIKINSRNYKILVAISSIVVTAAIGYLVTQAGSFTPLGAPADTMHTLDDIYHMLTPGSGAPTSYGIDSPASPAGTMHTLEDIYNKTPDFRTNAGTAIAADVFKGNDDITFYSNSSTKLTGTLRLACDPLDFLGTNNKVPTAYDGAGDGTNRWCMEKVTGHTYAAADEVCDGGYFWVGGVEYQGTRTWCTSSNPILTWSGSTHSWQDCWDGVNGVTGGIYGTGVTGTICRFNSASCPSGWTLAALWQRYSVSPWGGDACGQELSSGPTVFSNAASTCKTRQPCACAMDNTCGDIGLWENTCTTYCGGVCFLGTYSNCPVDITSNCATNRVEVGCY